MASVIAIISKELFEQRAGSARGGDVLPFDGYTADDVRLASLSNGGDLYLVTLRPPDSTLWLVGVLRSPAVTDGSWRAAANAAPLTDISALAGKIRLESGSGLTAEPSQHLPSELADADVSLLESALELWSTKHAKQGKRAPNTARAKASSGSGQHQLPPEATDPSHPALEAAIFAQDDDAAWTAFGDWLRQQRCVRGDAIALESQLAEQPRLAKKLKAAYRALSASSPLATLTADGSWQLSWKRGYIEQASFVLARTRKQRAKWVKERWERRAEIDHAVLAKERELLQGFLSARQTRFLRALSIELSEFRELIAPTIEWLLEVERPLLRTLRLAIAHYTPGSMGANDSVEHKPPLVKTTLVRELCRALPELTRLELVGHGLFSELAHPKLRSLRLEGHLPVLGAGYRHDASAAEAKGLDLPMLEQLQFVALNPSGASRPPRDAWQLYFDPHRLPQLKRLELHESDLGDDAQRGGVVQTIAKAEILHQLRVLTVRRFDFDWDDEPEAALARYAAKLGRLEEIYVDQPFASVLREYPSIERLLPHTRFKDSTS